MRSCSRNPFLLELSWSALPPLYLAALGYIKCQTPPHSHGAFCSGGDKEGPCFVPRVLSISILQKFLNCAVSSPDSGHAHTHVCMPRTYQKSPVKMCPSPLTMSKWPKATQQRGFLPWGYIFSSKQQPALKVIHPLCTQTT